MARLLTDAIIASLRNAGITTGDGVKPPTDAGWRGTPGQSTYDEYVVVHSMAGGDTDGTIHRPDDDRIPLYQISAWGAARSQCELLADEAHEVILGVPIALAAGKVAQVRVDVLGGSRRVDDIQPSEWMSAARYRFLLTD